MLKVFKREIQAYFRSMTGYVYLAAFFVMCGYFFVMNNLIAGVSDISGVYSGLYIGMAILIPALTMDTLLVRSDAYGVEYSLYISATQMVMGKYLAVLALTAIGIVGTAIYTGILAVFCHQDLTMMLFNQLGLLLLASCFTSVGLFASAISYRRTQALIMTYTLLLMFYMLDSSFQSIFSYTQIKTVWLFSFFSAYGNFDLGLFSPTGVLGLIIFSLVVVAVTASMINRRKEKGA